MIGPQALLGNGERTPHQRLGLGQSIGSLQQLCQIAETDGDVGMLGAQALLVDGERTPHQRLGIRANARLGGNRSLFTDCEGALSQRLSLSTTTLRAIELRKITSHYADSGVVRTPRCFNNAERAPVERPGLRQPALLSVKLCQV